MRLGRAFSTLLGPEGTTWAGPGGPVPAEVVVSPGGGAPAGVWLLFQPGMTWFSYRLGGGRWLPVAVRGWWGLWVVGWSLVENCTVDASILFSVVKLSRADGGCLGTRSR
jgi:hypothetical protein